MGICGAVAHKKGKPCDIQQVLPYQTFFPEDPPLADDQSTVTLGKDSWVREPVNGHDMTLVILHDFAGQGDRFIQMPGGHNIFPENIKLVCPSAPMVPTKDMKGVFKTKVDRYHNGKIEVHSWQPDPNQPDKQFTRLWGLLDREVGLLGGDSTKVFLVGQSQGCDLAMKVGLMYGKTLGEICGLMGKITAPKWKLSKENTETRVMFLTNQKIQCKIGPFNDGSIKKQLKKRPYYLLNRKNFTWEVMDSSYLYNKELV